MQIRIPVIDCVFVGKSQEAGDFTMDRETDHQDGTDVKLGQPFQLVLRRFRALQRIGNLDDFQMAETLLHPFPVVQLLANQDLGICLREARRCGDDRLDVGAVIREQRNKRRITAGCIRQFGDIGLKLRLVMVWIEIQDADGDLGL